MGRIGRRMKIINRLIWGAAAIAGTVAVIGWVASSGDETPAPPATAVRTTVATVPTTTTTTAPTTTTTTTAPTTTTTTTAPTTTTTTGDGYLINPATLLTEVESVRASLDSDMALLEYLCTNEILEDLFLTQGAEAMIEYLEECAGISARLLDTIRRWRSTAQQFTQQWPEIDEGWEMLRSTDEMIGTLEIHQEDIDAQVEEYRSLLEDLGLI